MMSVLRPEEGITAGDRLELEIFGEIHAFRYCPPGTFLMGSPEDEEGCGWFNFGEERVYYEPQHEVRLTHGFWLGETFVTQKQWTAAQTENPNHLRENPSHFKGDDLPVELVHWHECQCFFDIINESTPRGYYFTFPTEAQWEYACRAGTTSPFSFGSRCSGIECNCDGRCSYGYGATCKRFEQVYLKMTTPVRSYPANPWGFYDMHGNVEEWCADWYAPEYYTTSEATVDPTGPPSGVSRICRGGCWNDEAKYCRSAARNSNDPLKWNYSLGFRVCLVPSGK